MRFIFGTEPCEQTKDLVKERKPKEDSSFSASGRSNEEVLCVSASKRYAQGGFGFVTEQEIRSQEVLQMAEAGMGFHAPQFLPESFTVIEGNDQGCFIRSAPMMGYLDQLDDCNSYKGRLCPLWFRADLGKEVDRTVWVTLTFSSQEDDGDVLVFAGRRHFVFHGAMAKGEEKTITFAAECLPIIPNGFTARINCRTLDIALVGKCPVLKELSVTPADLPVFFMAGDSTMQDNGTAFPYHPSAGYAGWGQALDLFLSPAVAVCNQAHNGRTTETFRSEGHFALILDYLRPNDFVLLQFGHNDQKHAGLQAENGYPVNLVHYIEEIRERGAFPLLATPVCRNTWKEEKEGMIFMDLLSGHAEAVRQTGQKTQVPVLDMNLLSGRAIQARGLSASTAFYHEGDLTHTNDFGGYRTAAFAAEEMHRLMEDGRFGEYRKLFEAVKLWPAWEPDVMDLLVDAADRSKEEPSGPAEHQAEALGQVDRLLGWINDARQEAGLPLL